MTYALLPGIPGKLKRSTSSILLFLIFHLISSDNPSLKAVFVVRDPIDRFISHYKFSVDQCKRNGLQSVSEAIDYLLDGKNDSKIYSLKSVAERVLSQIRASPLSEGSSQSLDM